MIQRNNADYKKKTAIINKSFIGIKRKCAEFAESTIAGFINILSLNRANSRLSAYCADNFDPIYTVTYKNEKMFFSCRNKLTKWRLATFFTKEPETIEWIDTFNDGEILFDIGANIGLYSIYAAKKGARVVAFEPESQNYALLNKNVYLNKCENKIMCFNIAISDKDSIDYLYLSDFYEGEAASHFGRATDEEGKNFNPVFKQGAVSNSLDSFLARYPKYFPSHIKIDVDGLEPEIIKGAAKTLTDKRLKSLSIEIDDSSPEHLEFIETIKSKGFSFVHKKQSDLFKESDYKQFFNYLFVKN